MEFTVHSALAAAKSEQLEDWIRSYLRTGDWINLGLANGLQLQKRWWLGPILVNISELTRVCGPEPEMEYHIPLEHWNQKITQLANSFSDVMLIPPLIAEYRSGDLSLRNGNHRLEAMRRKGWSQCWIIVWHDTEADFLEDRDRKLGEQISCAANGKYLI
jgi:hypothetical protein